MDDLEQSISLRFSNYKLSMYRQCPRKYRYHYVDGMYRKYKKDRPYLSLGESVHLALKDFFLITPEKRSLDILHGILEKVWVSRGYSTSEEEREYKHHAMDMLSSFYRSGDISVRPVFLEHFFQIPMKGFVLTGKIDRLDRDNGGGLVLVDYKTGKQVMTQDEADRDLQISLYNIAIRKTQKLLPEKTIVYFLGENQKVETRRSHEDLDRVQEEISSLVEHIKTDSEFEPRKNPFCRYCDYAVICPAMNIEADWDMLDKEQRYKRTIQQLESINKNLLSLYEAGQEISAILDREVLMPKVLKNLMELSGGTQGALYLFEDHTDTLHVEATWSLGRGRGRVIPSASRLITLIDQAGKLTIARQPLADEVVRSLNVGFDIRESTLFLLLLIESKEKPLGVAVISTDKTAALSENNLILIKAFAAQAAIAIDNSRLYKLAITDGLTGMFIQRYFLQRLEEEIKRSRRYREPFMLIMTDLDFFKRINDTYGHSNGDVVLRSFAAVMQKKLRMVDIPARYGGEEFAVILPGTDTRGGQMVAERLRQAVEAATFVVGGHRVRLTVSIGVAKWLPDDTAANIIEKSDRALYQAKKEGRNRVVVIQE